MSQPTQKNFNEEQTQNLKELLNKISEEGINSQIDWQKVVNLINDGADPNTQDSYSFNKKTILWHAVNNANDLYKTHQRRNFDAYMNIIIELLQRGVDPTLKDSNDSSAFLLALSGGNKEIFNQMKDNREVEKWLADKKNVKDSFLHAIRGNNVEIVNELLERQPDLTIKSDDTLSMAVSDALRFEGMDQKIFDIIKPYFNKEEATNVLPIAVNMGNQYVVNGLLEIGADPLAKHAPTAKSLLDRAIELQKDYPKNESRTNIVNILKSAIEEKQEKEAKSSYVPPTRKGP